MALKPNVRQFVYYQKTITPEIHLLTPNEKKHHHKPAAISRDWGGIIREHVKAGGNLGFNPASAGLLVVDIDVKRVDGRQSLGALFAKHGIVLPETTQIATPSGGTHFYLDRSHYPDRLWSHLRDCPGVDFLSGDCNVVCAGSVLEGGAYVLQRDCPPAPAPDALLELLRMGQSATTTRASADPTISEIALGEALEALPNPDLCYDDYLKIGMAIHFETGGSDRGLEMWMQWAAKSDKFIESDCAKRWASFSTSGNDAGLVTYGTIDRIMNELNISSFKTVGDAIRAQGRAPVEEIEGDDAGAPYQAAPPPAAAQESAPGLVGRITEYILSVSISPLPEAAMLAALNIVSLMSRNRYTVGGSVRLNLFTLLAARTGAGKDSAFGQTARILAAVDHSGHLASGVTSGPALRKHIAGVNGHYLSLHIDEASKWLAACSMGGSAGKHDMTIRYEVMELYSKAGSVLPGRIALSPNGKVDKNSTDAINQPFLSMMLATTPERLMQSLQSIDFADGFLNRMLTVRTEYMPELRDDIDADKPVPQDIIDDLKGLATAWIPLGDDDDDDEDDNGPADRAVPEAPSNIPIVPTVKARHRELLNLVRSDGMEMADLWQRVPEITMKVAGIVALGCDKVVTHDIYDWSYRLVYGSFETLIESIAREHAESPTELLCKQIMQFVEDPKRGKSDKQWGDLCTAGAKPLSMITRIFLRAPSHIRDAAINSLVEAGMLEIVEIAREGSHKKVKVLVATG